MWHVAVLAQPISGLHLRARMVEHPSCGYQPFRLWVFTPLGNQHLSVLVVGLLAVVAEEIRVLADSSTETAGNIKTISSEVVNAVQALMECANELLHTVNDNMLPDYQLFFRVADQYSNDAGRMQGLIDNYKRNMSGITELVNEMAGNTGSISETVSNCKIGISETTQNITTLVQEMEDINLETENIFASEEQLQDKIRKYKTE